MNARYVMVRQGPGTQSVRARGCRSSKDAALVILESREADARNIRALVRNRFIFRSALHILQGRVVPTRVYAYSLLDSAS